MFYMKHVANRRKIVSPLPRKSYNQPKTVEKKSANTVALKSGKKVSDKAVKSVAAKSAPIVSMRNVKPKTTAPKKEIVLKALKKADLTKKNKTVVNKSNPVVPKETVKRKTEKIVPKTAGKAVKTNAQKTKTATVIKKNRTTKVSSAKVSPKVPARIEKPKTRKTAPKSAAVKSVKAVLPTNAKTPKSRLAKSKTQTIKVPKAATKKTVKTGKIVEKTKKPTTIIAAKKVVVQKAKPTVNKPLKVAKKTQKLKPTAAIKETVKKTRKTKPLISTARTNQPAKKGKPMIAKIAAPPKPKKLETKVVKANAPKIKVEKTKVSAPAKIPPSKKAKAIEPAIETVNITVPKPKKKKVKPIGAAIFRGKKERYDFQVFPVDGEFEDAAAIFIISKRKVDKRKKAHHKMVCIGQTTSVLSELKKHRKGKCFKKYEANAISVMREENEQKRLKIESDLKSAHTIPCLHA
jgi:hypothetical protein